MDSLRPPRLRCAILHIRRRGPGAPTSASCSLVAQRSPHVPGVGISLALAGEEETRSSARVPRSEAVRQAQSTEWESRQHGVAGWDAERLSWLSGLSLSRSLSTSGGGDIASDGRRELLRVSRGVRSDQPRDIVRGRFHDGRGNFYQSEPL